MVKRHDIPASIEPRRVVFLAFSQVVLLDLAGPWEVFCSANALTAAERPPYELILVSGDDSAAVPSCEGISMASHRTSKNYRGAIDTLIVPAAVAPTEQPSIRALAVLRRLAARSRRVVSICGGAFLLAAAGLLNGKKATTHWRGTAELAARFPEIAVEADSIFVKDGNVYTSAGSTAGIDLALALVEEDLGRAMALSCARSLVVSCVAPAGSLNSVPPWNRSRPSAM